MVRWDIVREDKPRSVNSAELSFDDFEGVLDLLLRPVNGACSD